MVETGRLIQRAGCGIDLMSDVGRVGQGPGPGHRLEAGQPELDRPPSGPRSRPRAGCVPSARTASAAPAGSFGVVDIAAKVSSAPMLFSGMRRHPALVPSPGERGQVRAGATAELCCSVASGVCAMSPPCAGPAGPAPARSARPRPTAPPPAAGAGSRASRRRGTTSSPSGLHRADASLATNLRRRTPTEQVMPCCSATVARIWRRSRRAAQPPERAGDVEERLVERERLHLRRDRAEDRHDLRDTRRTRRCLGATNTACGHSRRARVTGIAERTPNTRAW